MKIYQNFIGLMMTKLIGFIPARMAASRFPGKPLYKILGKTLLEHVYERASRFKQWDELYITTCDKEIYEFALKKNYPIIMTSNRHERALDRVAEAAEKCAIKIKNNDIVINVQGDEPMLKPDMISKSIEPMLKHEHIKATILGMDIVNKEQFYDSDILKIIHDIDNRILYTSRSPIPFTKKFNKKIGAKRVYGIFSFKWSMLKKFISLPPSPLEIAESCDSNRLYDNGLHQYLVRYKYFPSFSVDSPKDIKIVKKAMLKDPLWGKY